MRHLKILFLTFAIVISVFTYHSLTKPQSESPPLKQSFINEKRSSLASNYSSGKTRLNIGPENTYKEVNESLSTDENFIIDCTNSLSDNEINDETSTIQLNQYLSIVENSEVPADIFASLLFNYSNNDEKALPNFAGLQKEQPFNKLAYKKLLQLCYAYENDAICNDSLYLKMDVIDRDNALYSYIVAAIKYKKGDREQTYFYLQKANKKLQYNEYFFEQLAFIEQNMAENSELNFTQRLNQAININAASISPMGFLNKYCQQTTDSIDISDVCLQSGKQLSKYSDTTLTQLIGLNIQKHIYQSSGELEQVNLLENQFNKKVSLIKSDDYQKALALSFYDEDLAKTWLNQGLNNKEGIAEDYMIEEAKYLSRDPNYKPCPILNN